MKQELMRIENYGNYGKTLGVLGDERVSKVLFSGATLLELSRCTHWVSAGTALGYYRDNTFIAHDTDIDFEIRLNYEEDNTEFLEELQQSFIDNHFELHRKAWYNDKLMQLAFVKDFVIFDIYRVVFNSSNFYDILYKRL